MFPFLQVDSYSAFYDNGGFSKTELEEILRSRGITTVIVTGLALDFCVYYTSKDAKKIGNRHFHFQIFSKIAIE